MTSEIFFHVNTLDNNMYFISVDNESTDIKNARKLCKHMIEWNIVTDHNTKVIVYDQTLHALIITEHVECTEISKLKTDTIMNVFKSDEINQKHIVIFGKAGSEPVLGNVNHPNGNPKPNWKIKTGDPVLYHYICDQPLNKCCFHTER